MEEIKNKKISIILSTFNEEIAIEKTINEIQKYIKNVEIIVVDDNSTDKTFEILKRLQNQNIKIFLRKKNNLHLIIIPPTFFLAEKKLFNIEFKLKLFLGFKYSSISKNPIYFTFRNA